MKLRRTHWVTIIKDKLNHPYYSSLIGKAYRVVSILEKDPRTITLRKTTRREEQVWTDYSLYYSITAKRHCYKPNLLGHGKYSLWEFSEVRKSTPEEIKKAKMLECAEKI